MSSLKPVSNTFNPLSDRLQTDLYACLLWQEEQTRELNQENDGALIRAGAGCLEQHLQYQPERISITAQPTGRENIEARTTMTDTDK